MPVLLYGLEACDLTRAQLSSVDFVIVRAGMKIFRSSSRDLVIDSLNYFGLPLPSLSLAHRAARLKRKLVNTDNSYVYRIVS